MYFGGKVECVKDCEYGKVDIYVEKLNCLFVGLLID